ncbi:MAG: FAD-binding oxidoreductase [Woeseia sp.]|nr:FAD-binding oxidoreductase [Woeseia sp.]
MSVAMLLCELRSMLGDAHVVPGEQIRAVPPAWETHQPCHARYLVAPATTAEVAGVLAACNAAGQSIVPYGGVTNLVQGCATRPEDIALSLARMNGIEELDATAQTLTAGAGLTLREAQAAADSADLLYPVDIGARDNCTLGGNIATNAGGTRVIRYGMTRDSILGLEAVLADGTVLSSMNRYIKNNSGFDLKQLFIGTEGVLGIVTRAVVRLRAKPRSHNVALLACDSYDDVLAVLGVARSTLDNSLCGFEVMWDSFYRKVTQPSGRQPALLPAGHECYVLVEAMGSDPATDDAAFASALEKLMESDNVVDGVLAKSEQERAAIWAIRHDVEWIVTGAQNFDVSLRVNDIGKYVEQLEQGILAKLDTAHVAAFGHLGDNNLHVSVLNAKSAAQRAFVEQQVYEQLRPFAGAISAEHGIGLEKRAWLPLSRTAAEIQSMRQLKTLLDPRNILNPGKVIG